MHIKHHQSKRMSVCDAWLLRDEWSTALSCGDGGFARAGLLRPCGSEGSAAEAEGSGAEGGKGQEGKGQLQVLRVILCTTFLPWSLLVCLLVPALDCWCATCNSVCNDLLCSWVI